LKLRIFSHIGATLDVTNLGNRASLVTVPWAQANAVAVTVRPVWRRKTKKSKRRKRNG
jgi:hypothetical protein